MRGLRDRSATTVLIVATALLSIPFLALGVVAPLLMPVQLWLVGGLYAAAVLLATRPIRIHPDADLSPSDVAILAGVVFLPPGVVSIVAGLARLTNDIVARKRGEQILRNATAIAISSGVASLVYAILWRTLSPGMDVPASIPAAVVAVLALVAVDLAQLYLLLVPLPRRRERRAPCGGQASGWNARRHRGRARAAGAHPRRRARYPEARARAQRVGHDQGTVDPRRADAHPGDHRGRALGPERQAE